MGAELHLVTGGGGYAGVRLGLALNQLGHHVILLDVNLPQQELPTDIKFVQGNICDLGFLEQLMAGVDCVYHLAAYGMSGREQLNKKLIEKVNIEGTKNIITACKKNNVKRLVYTSTYNTVFVGQEIHNGKEEDLQYPELCEYPDYYSRTKAIAEKIVLKSDGDLVTEGNTVEEGNSLRTCALRLAGVYGPGERRHIPRIMTNIRRGIFKVVYGNKDAKVDFLHIDNFVQAHIKAGIGLREDKQYIAGGQVYFISDGKPINNFEFFRPLVEAHGQSFPTRRIPYALVYFFGFLTEVIHNIIGRVYNFQPILIRAEVHKTGVQHTFSIEKAKSQLGYVPTVQNDMQGVIDWCEEHGELIKDKIKRNKKYSFLVDICLIIIIVIVVMSFLPTTS